MALWVHDLTSCLFSLGSAKALHNPGTCKFLFTLGYKIPNASTKLTFYKVHNRCNAFCFSLSTMQNAQ